MIILQATIVWWGALLIGVGAILVGAIVGFFVSRKVFQRYLEKNPPINEKMIRAMMSAMGRNPSERQVRQVMAQMNIDQSAAATEKKPSKHELRKAGKDPEAESKKRGRRNTAK